MSNFLLETGTSAPCSKPSWSGSVRYSTSRARTTHMERGEWLREFSEQPTSAPEGEEQGMT